ncbi:MAG TPA: glycoside hydrolase family 97 N-terminal domain-containing protein, partial [Blastocatellia bacterium]|nr:glycoside hydrolase family 97 N-terminal domain-containing protein [Blastocatellia bacterium]
MDNRNHPQRNNCSRRKFLATALAAPAVVGEFSTALQTNNVSIASPDGKVQLQILPREQARLSYRVSFKNQPVLEASTLGIVVDGVDLCQGVEVGKAERYRLNERYDWRGVHSVAVNQCNGAKLSLKHTQSNTSFTL